MKPIFWVLALAAILQPLWGQEDAETLFYNRVVQLSQEAIGLKKVPAVGDQGFTSDCIGFVRYVYYQAGLDLSRAYGNGDRGVNSLYQGLSNRQFLFTEELPRPGDLVFFDNTYDVNRNGKWDDPLSHIGIVESVGKHDTISYIHWSSKGVARYQLNLRYPNTYAFRTKEGGTMVINSYLRKDRGEGFKKRKYISANFFREFARIPVRFKGGTPVSGP